jgi:hypothetical protein
MLPILEVGGTSLVFALLSSYARLKRIPIGAIPQLNASLIAFPAFFLWIPISLLLGNTILFLVPPLRRLAERHTTRSHGPSFRKAQVLLAKLAFFFAIVTVPLIALGFWL